MRTSLPSALRSSGLKFKCSRYSGEFFVVPAMQIVVMMGAVLYLRTSGMKLDVSCCTRSQPNRAGVFQCAGDMP